MGKLVKVSASSIRLAALKDKEQNTEMREAGVDPFSAPNGVLYSRKGSVDRRKAARTDSN